MNRIYELNHGLGVPPHHLALWTQLFTVGTAGMVQKATSRVSTVLWTRCKTLEFGWRSFCWWIFWDLVIW